MGLGWRYRWGQGGGPEKNLACLRQRGSPLRRVLALCSGTAGPPLGLRLKGVRGGVGRLPAGGPCVCGVVEPPNHVQAMGASPPWPAPTLAPPIRCSPRNPGTLAVGLNAHWGLGRWGGPWRAAWLWAGPSRTGQTRLASRAAASARSRVCSIDWRVCRWQR